MFTRIVLSIGFFVISNLFVYGETLKVGVTSGPHLEVMDFVARQAKEEGLELKVIEFSDYILPNIALNEGSLDLNSYQHEPFLKAQIESRGYKLKAIGKTLLFPIGMYSSKYSDVKVLPYNAKVAIPNDPANGARALLLLESLGLIALKDKDNMTPSVRDIRANPKKIKIIEVESPQLPQVIRDVDAAIINTDWVLLAGMNPAKDAIAQESKESPYANVIVVREKDADNPLYLKFVKIYQSDKTREFVTKKFGENVLPAW